MKRTLASALVVALLLAPGVAIGETGVAEDAATEETPVFALGPTVGYALRQLAIQPEGGGQIDLFYQYVNVGLTAQLFGYERWFGVRMTTAVDFFTGLRVEGDSQPSSFGQNAIWAEVAPTFTWMWGQVGITSGVGVAFIHYFDSFVEEGLNQADVAADVKAQEVLQLPIFVGAVVEAGGVHVMPEVGASIALWYDTADASISGATAAGLDFWLRVSVAFPLL